MRHSARGLSLPTAVTGLFTGEISTRAGQGVTIKSPGPPCGRELRYAGDLFRPYSFSKLGEIIMDERLKFKGSLLRWPMARSSRSYRVYVVEPNEYSPEEHAKVFNAALTALVAPQVPFIDPFAPHRAEPTSRYFDLVTFPEAFLPKDELISTLTQLSGGEPLGCVHVGLRPNANRNHHLFRVKELSDLVEALFRLPSIERTDLRPFSTWLGAQPSNRLFNIGCLFTIDSGRRLRVCLHPKLVRSRFEANPLHEDHMTEADLLTLVTLSPSDPALFSVTVQPLICSDALQLSTDRPHSRPMDAVNTDAFCLGDQPPDHVDVVSVATCSPQMESQMSKGDRRRCWHTDFTESFRRAASDDLLARHHYAVFVLANFRNLPNSQPGGLSGVFIPLPSRKARYPDFVNVLYYGRPKDAEGAENRWTDVGEGLSSLGQVISLNPFASGSPRPAYMLGLTVGKLPRDTTPWKPTAPLADFEFHIASYDSRSTTLTFTNPGAENE